MKKILSLFLALFFCSSAFAEPFKQIIFFGDSLSDNGNLHRILKVVPKSAPYYLGRFSNGPTWAEDLYQYYYDKYYIDGENYCYGGATSIVHKNKAGNQMSPFTLQIELDSYLLHSMSVDKSKVLYAIWIGANDYLYETTPEVDALTQSVVDKISWAITTLINQGATKFLIMNLPDMGETPYARSSHLEDRLHSLTVMHNTKLHDKINELKKAYPSVKFVSVDVYSSFNDLIANPEKYNQLYKKSIKEVSEACLIQTSNNQMTKIDLNNQLKKAFEKEDQSSLANLDLEAASHFILETPPLEQAYRLGQSFAICSNANEHVFWDAVHPTMDVHQILSDIVVKQLADEGEG